MGRSILIVDNARHMHALVCAHVEDDEEIRWYSAYSGEEALMMAATLLPDLILLDIRMPDLDGYEVCRKLKSIPATCGIPVIFLTAASTTDEKVRGLNLGAIDYVTKPFEPAELTARVRSALRVKDLLDLLAEKAQVDGLTGLGDRSYFNHRLECEIASSQRHGHALSCLLLDVDHFKDINDRFGHPIGDRVLRATARALTAQCRREDVVCRYGGDEFAILAPNTNASGAAVMAEHLRRAVEDVQVVHAIGMIPVRCSIGVCDFDAADGRPIVEVADLAMDADRRRRLAETAA